MLIFRWSCCGQEIIKRCEQNVQDHKGFVSKFADASQWLIKSKEKFAECSDAAGSRAELEDRLDKVQVWGGTLGSQPTFVCLFVCLLPCVAI